MIVHAWRFGGLISGEVVQILHFSIGQWVLLVGWTVALYGHVFVVASGQVGICCSLSGLDLKVALPVCSE